MEEWNAGDRNIGCRLQLIEDKNMGTRGQGGYFFMVFHALTGAATLSLMG